MQDNLIKFFDLIYSNESLENKKTLIRIRKVLFCLLENNMLKNETDIEIASYRILNIVKNAKLTNMYRKKIDFRGGRPKKNVSK